MNVNNVVSDVEDAIDEWYPRAVLRRTNWLYRVDALRPSDVRDMHELLQSIQLCQAHAQQFVIWANVLRFIRSRRMCEDTSRRFRLVDQLIMQMAHLFLSEGYCHYIDYLQIAFYPSSNRINNRSIGLRYPPIRCQKIALLGENESRTLTGLSTAQLHLMLIHLRIPKEIRDRRVRRVFDGEEAFLHYMAYNRLGLTKLQLSLYHFGGDPRRFTYSIRLICDFIYKNFYHKISGNSMQQWLPYLNDFRQALWSKVISGGTIETSAQNDLEMSTLVHVHMPLETFRIYGFLDDTGFRTTAPGREARRKYGFTDDIQRSFYSGYFSAHGIKAQVLSLPNGMIGSIYLGSWRVSDSGMLNLSGLDNYLTTLFHENEIIIPGNIPTLPVVYGDGVFPCLPTILPRYNNPNVDERRINTRLSSIRQNIEHIFGVHKNIFQLFNRPEKFKLLHQGQDAIQLIFNSFLLLNCYTCFNESTCEFILRAPTISEYLPLDEQLPQSPTITDDILGEVYDYYIS